MLVKSISRSGLVGAVLLPVAALGAAAALITILRAHEGSPCPASLATRATQPSQRPLPSFSHVVVIVMENRECGEVLNRKQAPYITRLARSSLLATHWYAISHPSLPNYLALTGGSTFGISSDCTSCDLSQPNLVDQLERAHVSWRAYMEGIPQPCFSGGSDGRYRKKHDPFLYYTDIAGNPSRCRNVVPLTRLFADLKHHRLPRFAWISPDLCHDMHDCSTRTGDRFLATLVAPILHALGKRGILFLTWDEGRSGRHCCSQAAGGNVATIIAGPLVKPGSTTNVPLDHYSLLKTIEDAWKLPELGEADCKCTRSLAGLLGSSTQSP